MGRGERDIGGGRDVWRGEKKTFGEGGRDIWGGEKETFREGRKIHKETFGEEGRKGHYGQEIGES